MTVRFLLLAIDDEKPLAPQVAAANIAGLPWELIRAVVGRYTVRHLQRLAAMSQIHDRQTVRRGSILPPHEAPCVALGSDQPGGDHVMASLFGGSPAPQPYIPMPSAPAPDDSAAQDAKRKELAADQGAVGRSQTILTQYALASQAPDVLKKTLGAA
jgi:hypothetical protein